jgi:hypothetical protein
VIISFAEEVDNVSILRIIASDAGKLTTNDREALKRGADELELAQRTVSTLYAQLIEAKQHLQATQARLKDANLPTTYVFPFVSMGGKPAMTVRYG